MKKVIFFLLILLVPIFACDDNDDKKYNPDQEVCGVKNPVENLPWLKLKIEQDNDKKGWSIQKVYTVNYNGEDLVLIHHPLSSLAYVDEIFDCQGNDLDIEMLPDLIEIMSDWVCIYDTTKQ